MNLIVIIAIVLVLGGLGGAAVWLSTRKRLGAPKASKALPAPRELELGTLRPDDVLVHFEQDYLVTGVDAFDERGQRWTHCHLLGGEQPSLLRVEQGDETRAMLLRACELQSFAEPPPQSLSYEDQSFALERWGKAVVQRTGDEATRSCRHFFYMSPLERVLVVLQFEGSERESWCGEVVVSGALELLPGS